MNKFLRAACVSLLGAAAAGATALACTSNDSPTNGGAARGDGGVDAGGDGGSLGDGGNGNSEGGGADGGSDHTVGKVSLSQSFPPTTFFHASAVFARTPATGTLPPCPSMVTVTMGACIASVLCVPPSTDAGTALTPALNAGAITVGGGSGAAGPAELTFGMLPGAPPRSGYAPVSGSALFFSGGDMLTAVGAGGPDLPAFPVQTVVAPSEITVTSPACTTGDCPLDRTVDLAAAWTGGGAGKVFFTYETISSSFVSVVTCDFAAAAGSGVIPAALLAHLEKSSDPATSGVFVIGAKNASPVFMVSDIPTTFEVLSGSLSGSLSISK